VKLLLDENISRRIAPALQIRFPGSTQVALLGLERSSDRQLCEFASEYGFVLCSKDDDFQRLVAARDYNPKVVYLAMGNASNDRILAALLAAADRIEAALSQPDIGIVIVDQV
jgi:predicted nuclease of predicted toxin-antitoxin system